MYLHSDQVCLMLSCLGQVEVKGVEGELKSIAESKLSIKPNFAYTLSQVRDDIQRVFDAGYFQQLTPVAEDTRDGIKLTLEVSADSTMLQTPPLTQTHPCGQAALPYPYRREQMRYTNPTLLNAQATANPIIKGVVVRGANVLPQKEIEEAFKHQFGCTLNFPQFSGALKKLNKWYEDRGIFGQVTSCLG